MADTTSIDDLPMGPAGGMGGSGQNMIIKKNDNAVASPMVYSPNVEGLSQSTGGMAGPGMLPPANPALMNEVVSGIQKASAQGLTMLPTRDIPMNPNAFTHDQYVHQPNYIPHPPPQQADYITNHENFHSIMRGAVKQQNRVNTVDAVYQEIQTPILLGIMYFIFQMPAFRANTMKFMPSLFSEDGNYKLSGLIAVSVGFAGVFYVIQKILSRVGQAII